MKKNTFYNICLLLLILFLGIIGCDSETENPNSGDSVGSGTLDSGVATISSTDSWLFTTLAEITAARNSAWAQYSDSIQKSTLRKSEVNSLEMSNDNVKMKYSIEVKGNPGPDGYPLYIGLHGGGASPANQGQWEIMKTYYGVSVTNGVYVATRAVDDTYWSPHSHPKSYYFYDRLIENLIVHKNVDPNRVYIMGFSAGGDGVYAITPLMADRFGAANMSSGHPNGVDILNLYNMPIALQGGENDKAFSRHRQTAEYGLKLEQLAARYPGHYTHAVWLHLGMGHNYPDTGTSTPQSVAGNLQAWLDGNDPASYMVNTNAVTFVSTYTRDPLPASVLWNVESRSEVGKFGSNSDSRTVESFYWLSVPGNIKAGIIEASYDKALNKIDIVTTNFSGELTILLNEQMIDPFSPIELTVNGVAEQVSPAASKDLLKETTIERGDPNYQFFMAVKKVI